jgi:hypothetical protein
LLYIAFHDGNIFLIRLIVSLDTLIGNIGLFAFWPMTIFNHFLIIDGRDPTDFWIFYTSAVQKVSPTVTAAEFFSKE